MIIRSLLIFIKFNSFGANGAVGRRYKARCSTATRRVATNRAKTLRIGAKYSTNRGLSAWPLTLSLCQRSIIVKFASTCAKFSSLVIKVIFAKSGIKTVFFAFNAHQYLVPS